MTAVGGRWLSLVVGEQAPAERAKPVSRRQHVEQAPSFLEPLTFVWSGTHLGRGADKCSNQEFESKDKMHSNPLPLNCTRPEGGLCLKSPQSCDRREAELAGVVGKVGFQAYLGFLNVCLSF